MTRAAFLQSLFLAPIAAVVGKKLPVNKAPASSMWLNVDTGLWYVSVGGKWVPLSMTDGLWLVNPEGAFQKSAPNPS